MRYAALEALRRSLQHIHEVGVTNIQAHRQPLIDRLQREMPRLGFESLTPPGTMSPIVSFAMKDPALVSAKLRKAKITVGEGLNRLRVSPSVFNDRRDVERLLEALA